MQYDPFDLLRRATAAWFRYGGMDQPNQGLSEVEEIEDRVYVVLRNINGILAVYRLTSQNKLRKLRRWPAQFEE